VTLTALSEEAVLHVGIFLRTHLAIVAGLLLGAITCHQLAALEFEVVSWEALEVYVCFPFVTLLVRFLPGRYMFFMVVV
jgi:hypothetical protein